MQRFFPGVAVLVILGFAWTTAMAENGLLSPGKGTNPASEQPIEITSRKLNVKYSDNSIDAVYEGNVKVRQGDVTMTCDRLVIASDRHDAKKGREPKGPKLPKGLPEAASDIKSITAIGNVKFVQGDRMATAGKAVFDNQKRTIELLDNPRLWQGTNRSIAEKIIIYLDEKRSELVSGDDTEISVIINPGEHKKEQGK